MAARHGSPDITGVAPREGGGERGDRQDGGE